MKYTWIEIETEEDFHEAFDENPRWILSSAPIATKAKSSDAEENVPERNGKSCSKRGDHNKTTS